MSRFADITEDDINEMLVDSNSKSWRNSIKSAGKPFQTFLSTKILSLEDLNEDELNDILVLFWSSLRKLNGDLFKTGSLWVIRQSLCAYIKQLKGFDILKDIHFNRSNDVFKAQTKVCKKQGKGDINHYKHLTQNDLQKVVNTLDLQNALQLQLLVFFYVMLYFARRGRENLAEMKKDFFIIKKTDKDEKYISTTFQIFFL